MDRQALQIVPYLHPDVAGSYRKCWIDMLKQKHTRQFGGHKRSSFCLNNFFFIFIKQIIKLSLVLARSRIITFMKIANNVSSIHWLHVDLSLNAWNICQIKILQK